MTAAYLTGLTHGLHALAYITGAALPALALLTLVAAVLPLARRVRHRLTVWRVRRQTSATGRHLGVPR